MKMNQLKSWSGLVVLVIMAHAAVAQEWNDNWPVLKTYEGIYLDELGDRVFAVIGGSALGV